MHQSLYAALVTVFISFLNNLGPKVYFFGVSIQVEATWANALAPDGAVFDLMCQ